MLPLLPILILLLMGPANAERLAVEGRLPAAILAVHRARVAPVRATVVAPAEQEGSGNPARLSGPRPLVAAVPSLSSPSLTGGMAPGWPARAGPKAA